MMRIKFFLMLFLAFVLCKSNAQVIVQNGVIQFEKKINMHKQLEDMDGDWAERMLKNMPKYQINNFELQFTKNESIYKKSKEQPPVDLKMRGGFGREDDDNNITYKNIDSLQVVAQKQVFEKFVLIKDSLHKTNWKITNEFRKIADMNCRKATTIIMDSIYVIAFYTDAIICSSGPENFNGLPGMILGIVLPRLNISYFATKITKLDAPKLDAIPTKGEPTNYNKLIAKMSSALDKWGGKWKNRMIWNIML